MFAKKLFLCFFLVLSALSSAGFSQNVSLSNDAFAGKKKPPQQTRSDTAEQIEKLIEQARATNADPAVLQKLTESLNAARSMPLLAAVPEPEEIIAFPAGATSGLKPEKEEKTGNAGGIFGFYYGMSDTFSLSFLYNISGDNKVFGLPEQFGSFLLNPSSNGSSFLATGEYILKNGAKTSLGLSFRGGISFTDWEATIAGAAVSHKGQVFFFVPSLRFCTNERNFGDNNTLKIIVDVGLGIRGIIGNLGQTPEFLSDKAVLGWDKKIFVGGELTISARINKITPFIRITCYSPKSDIPSFSDLQAYIGIDVISTLFSSKVNSPEE